MDGNSEDDGHKPIGDWRLVKVDSRRRIMIRRSTLLRREG